MANNKKVFWGICIKCSHRMPCAETHRCYYKDEDDNCNFEWEGGGLENLIKEVMDKYEKSKQKIEYNNTIETIEPIEEHYCEERGHDNSAYCMRQLPSVKQEQNIGHWIYICNSAVNGLKIVKCSECGKRTYGRGNYCPNCGAKMEVERWRWKK